MAKEKFMFKLPPGEESTGLPLSYAYNNTDISPAEASYLQSLAELAATEDLSQDLRGQTRVLSIVFTASAALFVALRFLARSRRAARIGIDDYVAAFALAVLVGNMAINLVLVGQGLGLHSGLFTLDELEALYKDVRPAEVLYVVGINAFKLSLLSLYYRLFPVRSVKIAGYIIGAFSSAWCVTCIFVAVFQCSPSNMMWQAWVEGTCIPTFAIYLLTAIPSLLCDLAIFLLPIPFMMRLKTTPVQKALLSVLHIVGAYVIFTGVYRFLLVLAITDDIPYTLAPPLAWDVVEIGSGIIAGCLPTLGPLLPNFFMGCVDSDPSNTKGDLGTKEWKGINESAITVGEAKSTEV